MKLHNTWAGKRTLSIVADRVLEEHAGRLPDDFFALCHGSRNGFEQNFLLKRRA